jgi:hypothetical protein
MNPFDALATFVLGKLKESAEMQVAKILFQLFLTAWGSFFLTCGGVLSTYALNHLVRGAVFEAGPVWALALGSAMGVMVVCVVYWIRTDPSKVFKGMRFVFPSAEAAAELAQDFEVIDKSNQEKK